MNYRMRVKAVTPLHIGTGDILLRDWDYVTGNNSTFVLDRDAVLAAEYERTGTVPTKPPGKLIAVTELTSESRFVRYALAGTTTLDQVHEQIKDVHGRCYLPGSSVKGALRTVLLAAAYQAGSLGGAGVHNEQGRSGNCIDTKAAIDLEAAAFRPKEDSANYDLLRALQIADSKPLPASPSPLTLQHVRVMTDKPTSIPICVEALVRNTTFETTLKLDDYLLKEQAAKLGWGARGDWLAQLPELANRRAQLRIERERKNAEKQGWAHATRVYEGLLKWLTRPPSDTFLVQMSWGAGWESMTIGTLLPPETQKQVRQRFKLGKPPGWRGQWQPDENSPFPKGHRMTVASGKSDAQPLEPMGWVVVEMKERRA